MMLNWTERIGFAIKKAMKIW